MAEITPLTQQLNNPTFMGAEEISLHKRRTYRLIVVFLETLSGPATAKLASFSWTSNAVSLVTLQVSKMIKMIRKTFGI